MASKGGETHHPIAGAAQVCVGVDDEIFGNAVDEADAAVGLLASNARFRLTG